MTPSGKDGSKRTDRRARLCEQIAGELEQGRRTKAARLVAAGDAHGACPRGAGLRRWLVESIGKERVAELIDGFARMPCFFCKKGVEPCDRCDGRGHSDEGEICEACLALGIARCDFCDGSGWAAIDSVPGGLRAPVVIRRAQLAISEMEKALKRRVPGPTSENAAESFKQFARLLLNLNRLVGVVENTILAAREQRQARGAFPGRKLAPVAIQCVHAAEPGETRARKLLEYMAASARLRAKAAGRKSRTRLIASREAKFYERLSRDDAFAGSSLEHPFLREAAKQLREAGTKKKPVKRGEPEPPASAPAG
jgi:hypothetical protein